MRKRLVELGANLLRDRLVRRVANQDVSEPKDVVLSAGGGLREQELLANERHQSSLQRSPELRRRKSGHRGTGELAADDGGPLDHGPLDAIELVEASGEQSLNRRRDRDGGAVRAVLGQHCGHLLEEERVSLRGLGDPLSCARIGLELGE